MSRTIFHVALCAVALSAAATAPAQSLLSFHGRILATTGESVTGLGGGEVFGGSSTFDSPIVDDSGMVLFRGRFTGGSASATNDRAYFLGDSRTGLTLLLRSGDPEPSGTIPGATLNTATGVGISGSPRIAGNGLMMFGASLNDGGVSISTANDTAIYVGFPGNFQVLVREGDLAVGTVGATMSSSFSAPSQQSTGLNGSFQSVFKSSLAGGDVVGTTNNEGLYTGVPGTLTLVLRKGDLAPGGEIVEALTPAFVLQLNEFGQVMYDVRYTVGSGTSPVVVGTDRALWMYTPAMGNTELVREGDAAPYPGAFFANAAGTWTVDTGVTTFDSLGRALLRTSLAGPGVSGGIDDAAVVLVTTAGHTGVARRGEAAPGLPGVAYDVFNNTSVQLRNGLQIAFQCSLVGASVTAADDSAIFAGTPGNLALVAREGDVAPGTGGSLFGSVAGFQMISNGAGQVVFTNTLVGGANPGTAFFAWDPARGLMPVILSGESIEVQPGVFATVTGHGSVQFGNGSSRSLSFTDDGLVTSRISIGSSSAIASISMASFVGSPRTVSETTGGLITMALNGGAIHAGASYIVAGSLSGTSPGIAIPPFVIPLNPDVYFDLVLQNLNQFPFGNTLGTLDPNGRAIATITLPPGVTGLAGLTFHHAFAAVNPGLVLASNAIAVTITP